MNLPIINTPTPPAKKINRHQQLRIEREALFERRWLLENDPFPLQIHWFNRCKNFIQKHLTDTEVIAELGCGDGKLTHYLLNLGKEVDALDIAKNALNKIDNHPKLKKIRDAMPRTHLPDLAYDAIIALDLIGEMEEEEYRLFISELARIGKKNSLAILSTPFDPNTIGGFERLLSLFSTEFDIIDLHLAHLRFQLGNQTLTNILESLRKFLWADTGITHAILAGRKKNSSNFGEPIAKIVKSFPHIF